MSNNRAMPHDKDLSAFPPVGHVDVELSEADIGSLAMLEFDEINFGALASSTLVRLTTCNDLFIATSALGELDTRIGPEAVNAAQAIFDQDLGDEHLQSSALSVLWGRDPHQAIQVSKKVVGQSGAILLTELVRQVALNGDQVPRPQVLELGRRIRDRLVRFPDLDMDDWTVEQFHRHLA